MSRGVREILHERNSSLLSGVRVARELLATRATLSELEPYRIRIAEIAGGIEEQLLKNLDRLDLPVDEILEDVLSSTNGAARLFTFLSANAIGPLRRTAEFDRLALRTIHWLHGVHPQTANLPAAVTSGSTAVRAFTVAPVYQLPAVEQLSLLYLPLVFHEFGHLIYQCHRNEMDDLVAELQRRIDDVLLPPSIRDDRFAVDQLKRRQAIIGTWYSWAQELFCDAVGYSIGGPSFLLTFSRFLPGTDKTDFYQERPQLERSSHPVTWLRVQLLADRAQASGQGTLASRARAEWQSIGSVLGVREDYHGFYSSGIKQLVTSTMADMLEEASPRMCSASEAESTDWAAKSNPVTLVNAAWNRYLASPPDYKNWEDDALADFVASDAPGPTGGLVNERDRNHAAN